MAECLLKEGRRARPINIVVLVGVTFALHAVHCQRQIRGFCEFIIRNEINADPRATPTAKTSLCCGANSEPSEWMKNTRTTFLTNGVCRSDVGGVVFLVECKLSRYLCLNWNDCPKTVKGKSSIGGTLRLCRGAWHSENLIKTPLNCSVSYFSLGCWSLLWGG